VGWGGGGQGYPEDENLWVSEKNVHCPHLILEFEAQRRIKEASEKLVHVKKAISPQRRKIIVKNPQVFDRGLEPENIITARKSDGQVRFLMKWTGTDKSDWVLAKEANVQCPDIFINFYEEHTT